MSSKLPFVSSDIPRDLRMFIDRVREMITGSGKEKLVTVGDLVSSGIAAPGPGGTITTPTTNVSPPTTPTGVSASGAIQNIIVAWDAPLYAGHSHAEVWGSATDDLGAAVQVGMAPGAIFVDAVGPSVVRYYWVRFINVLGAQGAFNAVAGVRGETGSDVSYMLDTLTDAALDPASPYTKFAVRADLFYVMPEPTFNQEATPTATATGDLWYQPSTELIRTWTGSTWGAFTQTLPFVVNSTPQTINGVSVPAGVYMDAAFIKNGTITNAKIGDAAIDDAKIVDATISAAKIQDAAITNAKIEDAAITDAKIDDAAITNAKIGTAAVTTLKIGANAVTVPVRFSYGTVPLTGATFTGSFTLPDAANVLVLVSATLPNDEGFYLNDTANGYYLQTTSNSSRYFPGAIASSFSITIDGTQVLNEVPNHGFGYLLSAVGSRLLSSGGTKTFSVSFAPSRVDSVGSYTYAGIRPRNVVVFILAAAR